MLNYQHLVPRRLHASVHHQTHAFQEFVTERVIPLTIFAQDNPGEEDGGNWFDGIRREVPGMRRKNPRPPQD